jgi:hypothetical protein
MPQSALLTGCADVMLPLMEIGPTIARLVRDGETNAS